MARSVKELLAACVEATIWDEADFALGESILDGLIKAAEQYDFALFVFGQDDTLVIRGATVSAVRENVVFELGLFIGGIGRGRAFWLSPSGNSAPPTITDLQGIIHLLFDEPDAGNPQAISASLAHAIDIVCKQVMSLGPRTDRTIEELIQRRTLCIASSQYSQARFAADIEYIHYFFSKGEVTTAHGISADQFSDYFPLGRSWDIVHLGVFVDKVNQHMLFDAPSGANKMDALPIQAVESMIKECHASLVIIITCDSLAFGARLARFTNVIAGHQAIAAGAAINWAKVFYQALAFGAPLSQAFNRAQDVADPGLILLAHKDFKFRPTIMSASPLDLGPGSYQNISVGSQSLECALPHSV
jgi:Predicted nucleotide-binding protein containing TIR-like domain